MSFSQKLSHYIQKLRATLPSRRQLHYSATVFSVKEKKYFKIFSLIIVLCVFWLIGSFYLTNYEPTPAVGGEYTEGLVGAPIYLNPILAQTNDVDLDISNLIFSSLLKYDQSEVLAPDLATGYEANEDGTVYTVHLREDAYWQGSEDKKVTADDVLFTIKEIQNPDVNSPLRASLLGITVNKIDDFTIQFVLKKPFAPFPSLLTFGILPEYIWSSISDQNFRLADLNSKPIGSGEWQVKSLNKDRSGEVKSITLDRNPKYYAQLPYVTKITFKFYPTTREAMVALERKEIDGLSFVPGKEIPDLMKKNKNLIVHSLQIPQYTALFFNQKTNSALRELKVRQALAHSINKNQISEEALGEEGQIIHSPILPGMLGYSADIQEYEFNTTKANNLLEEASWSKISIDDYIANLKKEYETALQKVIETTPENANEPTTENQVAPEEFKVPDEIYTYPFFRKKGSEILSIKITTVDLPENIRTANIIKNAWKQIGVLTEIELLDSTTLKNFSIKERSYQALLFGHIIGHDPDPYPFWHSSQATSPGLNLAGFSNKRADQVLLSARETKDLEKRSELYKEFQKILNDELPAIFLYNPTYNYLLHQKILGAAPVINIISPADRFNNLGSWYIKTKSVAK